ncbi:galactose-specific lectin nattectin-like, partial [Hippocampus zosterae]|uniref:galactose-specific lectin nattectin-like n=1 Tax=Hippocampus zosterae TaxID=109293 RepID=UPI00223E4919
SSQWSYPISQERGCPEGWTQVDCSCFLFQDEERQFADAESVCNILGGNLASVHSALENAVIVQLNAAGTSDSSSDIWIGLHEAIEEGTFFWTDDSPVDFTNFKSDNDSGDCLAIENDDVLWDKDPCSVENKFVCAREADQRDPPYKSTNL